MKKNQKEIRRQFLKNTSLSFLSFVAFPTILKSTNSIKNNDNLSFLAFLIFSSKNDELSDLTQLQKWGFDVPITLRTDDPRQVQIWHSQWINNELFSNFPTNGIVAKCNSSSTKDFLGVGSSSPNCALALTR